MGNEMGNNNISGLKGEENTAATEDSENYSLKANLVDHVNGENQIVPAGEGKDFHEKVEDLSSTLSSDDPSGVGDPQEDKQTSVRKELDDETELEPSFQSTEEPIESIDSACQDSAGASPKEDTQVKPSSESTQVLLPLESNDSASEENKIQAGFSPKDVNNLERAIEPKQEEENLLGTSDHQIQKQTSPRREASDSTYDFKSALLTSEPLESAAVPQSHQREHDEVPSETQPEECNGSPSCQAEEEGKSLETEATQNLALSFASDAKTDDEEEMDLGGTSIIDINHRCEITSENEMDSNLSNVTSTLQSSLDHKCNEEAPPEMNLSGNGSSESPQDQAISQAVSSSNSFEEVAEPQDKCMVLAEDTENIGNLSENEETNHHSNPIHEFHEEEAVTEINNDHEFNASQLELVLDGSSNSAIDEDSQRKQAKAGGNGYQVDTFNSELKEKNEDFEEVQAELTFPQEDHVEGEEEEEERTEKIIKAVEEKAEILKALEICGAEAKETTEQPMPQSNQVDYANSLFSETSTRQLMSQDTVIGSETVESRAMLSTDLKSDSCCEFIVAEAASNANSNNSEKEMVTAVRLENEKPEQELQKFSVSETETETAAEQLQPNEQCAEVETPAFTSPSNEAAEESAGNHAAELRKSPSFVFDLSLDPMYEVSDQTPLLHRDKTATRSQSRSLDGASFCNPTAESTKYGRDLVQNQAISVEEKTIKVERSDSDKSRGPFMNLLKKEENARAAVRSEKGVKEVAITKGRGKRKPRPSLFSTCICCAAAIN